MRGSYRFKRFSCHADMDVSVSVECVEAERFSVEVEPVTRSRLTLDAIEGIDVGLGRVSIDLGSIAVRVVEVLDHSGKSPQFAYAIASEAAVYLAMGRPDLAPAVHPGLLQTASKDSRDAL